MTLEQQVKGYLDKNACNRYEKKDNLETIIRKWHEPYGIEFCEKYSYPPIDLIRNYKEEFERYNVYVDREDLVLMNTDVILFNCVATLHYFLPEKKYSAILYNNNIVTISANSFAFVICKTLSKKNSFCIETFEGAKVSVE